MREKLIEAAAKAGYGAPDWDDLTEGCKWQWRRNAERVVDALLTALEQPTDEMVVAASEEMLRGWPWLKGQCPEGAPPEVVEWSLQAAIRKAKEG